MRDSEKFLNSLLNENDVVVIGCSGGPDSMALLNLLIAINKIKNINIICAHVNHNVRKESAKELVFLKQYCEARNILFESMKIEKYGDDNFENEARNIRYNFFDTLVEKYNAKYLMTAHHGDDLIETILMRIVRGSTMQGYSGFNQISNKSNYKIVRPLIYTTKKEIEDYNSKHKIPYVIDKTNFLKTHTRNRYRKIVLPFLKKEDKNVHKKFLKYSKTLIMYDNYVTKELEGKLPKLIIDNKLNIKEFNKLQEIFKLKVLYHMLETFYEDDLILISDSHVNLILKLIESNKANSYIYLPNNIKVVKIYNELSLSRETEQIDNYEIELGDYIDLPNGKVIEKVESSDINNNYYCRLSTVDVEFPLRVRTRKNGDKMIIKNMKTSKKLKDIFIDLKIPIKDRDIWPVVVDSKDKIVWLPGLKKSKYDIPKNKKCDIIFRYR